MSVLSDGRSGHAREKFRSLFHTLLRRQGVVAEAPANAAAATTDVGDLALLSELFGQTWGTLAASEQARALRLLVERVDYDGSAGQVRIRLRADGITSLARDWAEREESV